MRASVSAIYLSRFCLFGMSFSFVYLLSSLAGIMTVTVVLSSDGGKMSLFQDLKLKRRKVDSRCSSDGMDDEDTNPETGSIDHGSSLLFRYRREHSGDEQ